MIREKNKIYICIKSVFCIFFAISLILDKMFITKGSVFGTIEENYFTEFKIQYLICFLILFLIEFFIISVIEYIVNKIEPKIHTKNKKNIKIYFLILISILILWLPYTMSFFPGGIYSDTLSSINQAKGVSRLNNHHPLMYAMLLKPFFILSDNQLAMEMFTIFQIVVMAVVCGYVAYWIYKRNISFIYVILTTLFFGLFCLIPLYAVSIWKDIPFCLALVLYILNIGDIVKEPKKIENMKGILYYIFLSLMVSFFRNNGKYIILGTTIILLLTYRKNIFNTLKKFTIISLVVIILTFIVQGPIYDHFKLNTEFVENLGVLLQQICYVVSNDGEITEEQYEFINNIYPIENIKEDYNPCIVDVIKWSQNFNSKYLEEHKNEFIKVWLEIFFRNPKACIKAQLLNTVGFWDINKATMDAYINPTMWGGGNSYGGIVQKDYIEILTNKSIRNILIPKKAISSAIFLLITMIGALMTIYKRKYRNFLMYVPAFITWITIMLAVPLAYSLRYVYILVLMIPISLIIPFLDNVEKK